MRLVLLMLALSSCADAGALQKPKPVKKEQPAPKPVKPGPPACKLSRNGKTAESVPCD